MAIDAYSKVVQTSAVSGTNGGIAFTQYLSGITFWASQLAEVKLHDSVDATGPVIFHWKSTGATNDTTTPTIFLNPIRLTSKNLFVEVVQGGAANTPEVTMYGK